MFEIAFKMIGLLWLAHFLFDYPLQGDFLAKAKNETAPIPGVPWVHAMLAHTFMHAAAVTMITGSWLLGAFEFAAHFWIDRTKCQGKIDFDQDQFLHLMMKVAYVILLLAIGPIP